MRLLVLAACTAVAAAAPFKHAVRALAKNGTAHVLAGAQPHWQTYNIKFILLDGSCQVSGATPRGRGDHLPHSGVKDLTFSTPSPVRSFTPAWGK